MFPFSTAPVPASRRAVSALSTFSTSRRSLTVAAAAVAAGLTIAACRESAAAPRPSAPSADRAGADRPGVHLQYGTPVRVGNGRARTYVVLDQQAGGRPLEVGVALDEAALEGLPAPAAAHGAGENAHGGMTIYDLELPQQHGTPYRFVQLDWNSAGHEPPGVYDVPHFDFHFYTITKAERDAIDPAVIGEAEYAARANRLPPEPERAAADVPLGPPDAPPAAVAVPRMGVHWGSLNAPELQGLFGHPEAARPFTTTFLRGSWDGRVTFDEPMVTRAFILGRKAAAAAAQRDSVMPLPAAQRYRPAGDYPTAYRVAYDAQAREYRIALTRLARRD
jgi:hypothetical protein